jgi:hypothetical protein
MSVEDILADAVLSVKSLTFDYQQVITKKGSYFDDSTIGRLKLIISGHIHVITGGN